MQENSRENLLPDSNSMFDITIAYKSTLEPTPLLPAEPPHSAVQSPPQNHARFSSMQMTLQFRYSTSSIASVCPKRGLEAFFAVRCSPQGSVRCASDMLHFFCRTMQELRIGLKKCLGTKDATDYPTSSKNLCILIFNEDLTQFHLTKGNIF